MYNRSLSRELSLISLGLIKDKGDFKLNKFQIEEIFESALDSLINHCRDELDNCESELENASQKILDSELQEGVDSSFSNVRRIFFIYRIWASAQNNPFRVNIFNFLN